MKAHIRIASATLAIAATMASTPAVRADTAIATKWRIVGEAQGDCMNHAAMAIFRLGFDKAPPGSQTMTGKKGDYTASIRCISDQRMVFFVLSGPSPDTTSRYLETLYGHF